MQPARLALLVLVIASCRGGETVAPAPVAFEHRRDDYASTTLATPRGTDAVVDALHGANAMAGAVGLVRLDERLSLVANELASRGAGTIAFDEMTTLAREAGSPLYPLLSISIEPATLPPGWADQAVARVPGNGPLAIGVSTIERADGRVVVVFARELVMLSAPVPRRGAARFEFQLHEVASALTPAVLVVAKDGPHRIPVQPGAEGHWIAQRTGGFDDTIVALLGTTERSAPTPSSTRGSTELLASLQFGPGPTLAPADADALPSAIAALRAGWHRTSVEFASGEATPCGDPVPTIAGRTVLLRQQCVTWTSTGTDAERSRALLVNPLALEQVADAEWQLAEIRRDPETTSVRLGRAFEDLTPEQVHARLSDVLKHRWPALAHDAKGDAKAKAIATKWASAPFADDTTAAIADESAKLAARWTKSPEWFRLVWSDQDLGHALDALVIEGTPTAFTLGTARGTGPEGEPRYFVVLLVAVAP